MPPDPPNAFASEFLRRLARQDFEPPTAVEADTAGRSQVVSSGAGFAVLREAESLDEGDPPIAWMEDRSAALLLAAALPAGGRDPVYRLDQEAGARGYPIRAQDRVVGHLARYDDGLVALLNGFDSLARSPGDLALVLEALGGSALQRVGRILERRLQEQGAKTGTKDGIAET